MSIIEKSNSGRLIDEDFTQVAELLGCEPAALKAVQQVETGGREVFFSGKYTILFEGIFLDPVEEKGSNPEDYVKGNENILYPKWEKGHYKGGIGEYDRLEQARKINREAADASASWGMFQIMGFNYAACGEESIESFVRSMCESEFKQLLLTANFIKKNSQMLQALQARDWAVFAKCYNGPAYAQNRYDVKLEAAYQKYSL